MIPQDKGNILPVWEEEIVKRLSSNRWTYTDVAILHFNE